MSARCWRGGGRTVREYQKVIRQWQVGMLSDVEAVRQFIQHVDPEHIAGCIAEADAELIAGVREQVEREPANEASWAGYWANSLLIVGGTYSGPFQPLTDAEFARMESDRVVYQTNSMKLREYFNSM